MTPQSLNFPKFFREFRPAQAEAISHVLESGSRFIAIGAPTGMGNLTNPTGIGMIQYR